MTGTPGTTDGPALPADEAGGATGPTPPGRPARSSWTFLTNHAHVLLTVAREPDVRVADLAARVGITARAALLVLRDLEDAGYLRRERVGRRTRYRVQEHRPLRHPNEASHEVDELIAVFTDRQDDGVRGG